MKSYVIDICCGLGGISLAAKQLGMNPLLGVDICENAMKTYEANFPEANILNLDITRKHSSDKIQKYLHDNGVKSKSLYVVSGPPCQGFSAAGKRQADDPRNNIIVRVASLISKIKPNAAIVENVSSIGHKRYDKTIHRFKKILADSDYYVCDIELNALDFGVPQRRYRKIFFVTRCDISENDYLSYINKKRSIAPVIKRAFAGLPEAKVRPDDYHDGLSYKGFFNHFAMQHSEKVKRKIAGIEPGAGPFSYRKLDPNNYAPTLISGHRAPPVHYNEHRSITAREAARIQSFPDSFRICGDFGSQLQQIANAVPPKLASVVLKTLLHFTEQ